MTPFVRNALLGAAGLVVMAMPAHAASSIAVSDTPLLDATKAKTIQLAQRSENPGGAGFRNENPGGAGLKSKKKKKKKMK